MRYKPAKLITMEKKTNSSLGENIASLSNGVKRLGMLYVEKARLMAAEKVSILLSTIAFTVVIAAIAVVLLVFVTIGVGHLLAMSIAPHLAYLIMAGFYLLLLIVAMALRRKCFINPISRFVSRIFVEAPQNDDDEETEEDKKDSASEPPVDSTNVEINYDILAKRVIDMLEDNNREKNAPTIIEIVEDEGGAQ